ncbi:MAG: GatB/YqeY domain-containing protein [Pseudomonadota bacterium]
MDLRSRFTSEMKSAMLAKDAPRTSTIRMIMAKLKDTDIAARPSGVDQVPEEQVISMLRGMVKSRRESVEMYTQGNRPELAAKEAAEIAVIESFLPTQMDEAATAAAVDAAIAEAGATSVKEMGKVMAVLRAKYAATLDMAKAGALVKAKLA